jgi:hypothetical protein
MAIPSAGTFPHTETVTSSDQTARPYGALGAAGSQAHPPPPAGLPPEACGAQAWLQVLEEPAQPLPAS